MTVVMPVFRSSRAVLSDALAALERLDYPQQRLVRLVVDNDLAGGDEFETWLRREHPAVSYLRSPRTGAHSARNHGLVQARAELCYFVDDDVLVQPDAVRALARSFDDPQVGAVGGHIRPLWRDGPPPAWLELFHDSQFVVRDDYRKVLVEAGVAAGASRLNLGLLSLLDLGERELDVDENWLYSCHLMVRRSAALAAGGFGPDLQGGYLLGDNEMGLLRRMAGEGWKLRYQPAAVVQHVIPAARLSMRYLARRTRNDGTCDAYITLRAGRCRGAPAVALEAGRRLAGSLGAAAVLGARALARDPRWRLSLAQACAEWGAADYFLRYLVSSRWRRRVHARDYIAVLGEA